MHISHKKRILTVIGTRPEAIKMAPLIHALRLHPNFDVIVCVTGQHQQMLSPMLDLFDIHPDCNLKVMQTNQSLAYLSAAITNGIDNILLKENPDYIAVQGDTTTALAAGMAGFYQKIPLIHIEAGLRTYDLTQPWPEEGNRALLSRISDYHFAPSYHAMKNLKQERAPGHVIQFGNTVIDALLAVDHVLATRPDIQAILQAGLPKLDPAKKLILVTGHRRENWGTGIEELCQALSILSARTDVQIIYPVHLNPKIAEHVDIALKNTKNLHLLPPLDHLSFIHLLRQCHFVITDSGGIQEEAPALGKPVLVTRDVTERQEVLETGHACLVGANAKEIVQTATDWLDNPVSHQPCTIYGHGHAGANITTFLAGELETSADFAQQVATSLRNAIINSVFPCQQQEVLS